MLPHANPYSFIAGCIVLVLLNRWKPFFPWFVIMAGMGMWFGYMVDMEKGALGGKVKRLETTLDDTYTLELMKDRFPWLEKNPDFFDLPDWEVAAKAGPSVLLSGSISVMLVAVLESLISGKIAAQKTSTEFDSQAEVFSVGGANLVCGKVYIAVCACVCDLY